MIPPAASYLLKSYLHDMVAHEGGIGGYIQEKIGLEEGQTLGDLAISAVAKFADRLSSLTKDFSILGSTMTIKTGEVQNVPAENATDEQLAEKMPTLAVSLDYADSHEEGTVSLDLSYIRRAIGSFMEKLQKTLSEGAWMNNPYAETPLVDDASNLVVNAIMPALTTPVEGADITSGLVRQLGDARSKYTSLYDLMESQRLVSEDKTSLFKVDLKEGATYLNLVANSVLSMDSFTTLADVIQPISILSSLGIALPGSLATPIQEKVAALHQTKTMDTNIPNDNEWSFHTVNFNANGGSVDQKSASTVEDGRLASLPQPGERAGYTFDGWFTAPTGGNLVGAEDDLSGVDMLYAQWTYTGVPEKYTEWSKYSPYRRANAGLDDRTEERTDAGTDRRAISYAREEQDEVARASSTTDLHTRFFGSVEKAHAQIHRTAAEDPAFAAFCEDFASRLTQTANGKYKVDLGSWLLLNADAVQALQACEADVTVTFACQGLWKIDDQGPFYADPIRRKV